MALNTEIPKTVNNLIDRLKAEATADSRTDVVAALTAIGKVQWYNLPADLNKLTDAIKLYQTYLIDGALQDIIDDIAIIHWYNIFKKVKLLIKTTELIETLT